MAICLECKKEYTPYSQSFRSAAGVHPELCPECATASAMVACEECGRKFTPPNRRPLFARSVQPEICPECVEAAEASFSRLMVEATPRVFVTPAIIIINLIIFAAMLISGVSTVNPDVEQLLKWGADYGPVTLNGQWWRLLSSTFVHHGAWHLALNMLCLWSLGRLAERMLGAWPFLAIYLLSGLGGSVASVWWNPAVLSVGASGGVSGVAGGLVVFWKSGKLSIPRKIVILTIVLLSLFFGLLSLFSGLRKGGVNHVAHLGGLVIGLALGASLQKSLTRIEGSSRMRAVLAYSGVSLALLLGIGAAYKSNRPFIKWEMANGSLEAGDFDQAIENYKEALEIKPDLDEARNGLGVAYFRKGSIDEALAAFKQTIEVSHDPEVRAMAQYNVGLIYFDKKLYDEAIDSIEKSMRDQPGDADTYTLLGDCYIEKALYEKAITAYRQALELKPDFAKAQEGLGRAHEAIGLYKQANEAYQEAIRLNKQAIEELKSGSMEKSGAAKNGRVK